ncbi:MAG: glucuronyl hydrolase [Bacteroidetes bacterium GWD2_45_23]|jgi:hypothetical protein|nr:MAG: glucuronyl hydrolase [Bacteroidetes bacterium GWC2_46_850]OFX87595.1 MAG: glucuronyl hydrolase [Bacteroidetes bacterium GWD2_45_23]HBB01449.1 glucuronyl hydrolase [Porphyromonadaceae bacterium]HCC19102.1 glucuronyl hydrolase [Porphyromonadaceae bacterium]
MEKNAYSILFILSLFLLSSCVSANKEPWFQNAVESASAQLTKQVEEMGDKVGFPRSIRADTLRLDNIYDWTSGFFPGSLWYMYELTENNFFKDEAAKFTGYLHDIRYYKGTHDLGFMIYCSYGNELRLTGDTATVPVMIQTADNLISRFNDVTQTIRSWDFGEWQYPVIIDNMMNLELLFWASEYTNDPKYRDIAVKHANTTLEHHFRDDMSSYHVINYDTITGNVISKGTFQGYSDESHWARGQAWGLYGYTVCYRYTKDEKYLKAAEEIARFIMDNVKTDDLIPYWDYMAPDIPDAPRDASAAAITCSALLELSKYSKQNTSAYYNYAETILKNLSGEKYLAKTGDNFGFVLMHSVGHLPANSEIDTPINYTDYYYLESLKRYKSYSTK